MYEKTAADEERVIQTNVTSVFYGVKHATRPVAHITALLASDEAAFITGRNCLVDGGYTIQ